MLDDAFVYTSCHRDWWIQQESPQGYKGNQEKKGSPEGKSRREVSKESPWGFYDFRVIGLKACFDFMKVIRPDIQPSYTHNGFPDSPR